MPGRTLMDLVEQFGDEDKARDFLEAVRWPNGAVCPRADCGVVGQAYKLRSAAWASTRKGVWKCRACRRQFTVTVGTVMEDSRIPLSKWVIGIHLLCSSKKGMSSHQLHRMLGLSYKAAWFMTHRIRYAMAHPTEGKLWGTVEVDETYVGGKAKSNLALRGVGKGRGLGNKTPVVSLVQRGGDVRSVTMKRVTAANLRDAIRRHVSRGAKVMTDEHPFYKGLGRKYRSHQTVKHMDNEYVRGEVTTNTVEGYFAILKRGVMGTYHHLGEKHLHRYLSEFDFRYNARKIDDGDRAVRAMRQLAGKRLSYKPLLAGG